MLIHNFFNEGRTNLYGWLEKCEEFCEEQDVEERTSVDQVQSIFYTNLHEGFFYSIPSMLYKILIKNGYDHIVDPRPPLYVLASSN